MKEIFYSNGWKKPYCYTIIDMHKVLNKPIDDKEGIMDGGYYIYGGFDKKLHIERLIKSNFKFIMGFDNCSYKEKEYLIELMLENKKNIYPIIKSKNNWKWLLEKKWKVEGIATANDEVINVAYKNGYNIHHLGRLKNKENINKITSLDINPYEIKKNFLLDLGNNIIKLNKDILSLGEFILYGSSLFVNNPNDIDLLYYGKLSEEEVYKKINIKKVQVVKFTKEKYKSGKITHLLYAFDNGIKLNECTNLTKMYNQFKTMSYKQFLNKCFLSYNYVRDNMYDKELKTLLILYYYYYKTELSKFLYERIHLIYKIIGDGDKKAEMLFNRMLYSRFKREFVLPLNNQKERMYNYKYKYVEKCIDMFFPFVNIIKDEEKILISCTVENE